VKKLVLVDAHANPDSQRDNLAPHVSVYVAGNFPDVHPKTDFSKMELFVELMFAETSDPFRDPKDPRQPQAENFPFENDSDVSRLNRGQLCLYPAAHTGSQFRVHTFTLSICGRSARFIRWDRSGATVTWRFDYIKDPHILASFSGVTHISTIANVGTRLSSHQHPRRISSRSSMSKNVCGTGILPIVNSV
jgi:hypothetical protein